MKLLRVNKAKANPALAILNNSRMGVFANNASCLSLAQFEAVVAEQMLFLIDSGAPGDGPVGLVELYNVDRVNAGIAFALHLNSEVSDRSTVKIIKEITVLCFEMGFYKVSTSILPEERFKSEALKSSGYFHEVRMRHHVFLDGRYHGVNVYGVTFDDGNRNRT